MNIKKSVCYGVMFGVLMASSVVVAARPKRMANGVLIEEPVKEEKVEIDRIAECGFSRPIRVATTVNNRPFGWVESIRTAGGAQKLLSKGFTLDVFEKVAKKLNLKYEVVGYTKDQEAIAALKKGNLDVLLGIYTPQQTIGKGMVALFPALFVNIFTVYHKQENAFPVKNMESLLFKRGMIRRTENIYPLFSRHLSEEMDIELTTTEDAFKKLMSDEYDYLIGSPYSIEAELRRYKLHEDIVSAQKVLLEASMYMVITRATDCVKLQQILSDGLKEFYQNPQVPNRMVRNVINDWGLRFREAEPLVKTKNNTPDLETTETVKEPNN